MWNSLCFFNLVPVSYVLGVLGLNVYMKTAENRLSSLASITITILCTYLKNIFPIYTSVKILDRQTKYPLSETFGRLQRRQNP